MQHFLTRQMALAKMFKQNNVIALKLTRAQFHQRAAFKCADPKSAKNTVNTSVFFCFWELHA